MDDVKPWIKDYFLILATKYGSKFDTAPPTEKVKRCQLKKVLTSEPKDYFWVLLSDQEHEVHGRIPKEVVEECIKDTKRDRRLTRHTGSLIEIRNFGPLFIRPEDGHPSHAPRKVLVLDIRKAKLRGAAAEPTWGNPQPLDSVQDLKEWIHELRKPDGNRDLLRARKEQHDEAEAAKQLAESSEPLPELGLRFRPAKYAPAVPQRKTASTTPLAVERLPMQRYNRKWKKAVPGLNEFAHRLQIPEDVLSKILEKQKIKEAKAEQRPSGTLPLDGPRSTRGALEIGSSPARFSSIPRATTPEEWPTSPGILKRLYNDRGETEMSSDVYSSRQSSPVDTYHETEPQPEPETVPETPQIIPDSQTQHLSPPPPAQPPRLRSPLPPSSNPQVQNHPTSPSSIHTSVQAVSGSQLPEKPQVLDRSGDVPSNGPTFVLPWTQHDAPPVAAPKPKSVSGLSPEKPAPKRNLGEYVFQAIEKAFPEESREVSTSRDQFVVLPAPKLTVAQPPPPKPRSKPPSKVAHKSLQGPSASDELADTERLESPTHQPLQALNRKVPVPGVGPTREPIRTKSKNGVVTLVLVPASDDSKLSSSSKQNPSSQPVQSSQSVPSSLPVPPSEHLPQSQPSEPRMRHSASQNDASIAQEQRENSILAQINGTVANVETVQDSSRNAQSSLEYASTQGEDGAVVGTNTPNVMEQPAEAGVVMEKAADDTSPLPRIVAICEVVSQQSADEEVDELENDSDAVNHPTVARRKSKHVPSNPSIKAAKRLQPMRAKNSISPSKPPKPALRPDSVVEKVPSRPPSKLSPVPVVVIERERTPVNPTDEKIHPAQKRRLTHSPSDDGFPAPQPIKRSKLDGHHLPAQTALRQTPPPLSEEGDVRGRTSKETIKASNQNQAVQKPAISGASKGKGRAEGIRGLENISTSVDAERELETVQVKVKKKAPNTGSKRKPSDAFSAQDVSRDAKRAKVDEGPEPRKLGKQLSFVDPEKLKRPFRSKPQVRKTPYRQEKTATSATNVVEVEWRQRVIKKDKVALENGHDSGNTRPRIDSRKASKSDLDRKLGQGTSRGADDDEPPHRPTARTRVQHPKPVKEVERELVVSQPRHAPTRKLGSFAPDLNPAPLPGLPGGRLVNKQLREILIKTGKFRTREAKAAELSHT